MNKEIGGMDAVIKILNEVDGATQENILSWMEKEKSDVAEEIRQKLFVFEDLVNVSPKDMRILLKAIDYKTLKLALKMSSEELLNSIYSNLSSRAGKILKEDIASMGPVRLAEVEEAHASIVKTAKTLENQGKIILKKGTSEVWV